TSSQRELVRYSVSPSLCPALKPDKEQPCNRLPCPCSTTCGRGISRRELYCPASDEALCGPKPHERKRRCRPGKCPPPSRLTITCPPSDTTQYCELFSLEDLKRNCLVPPFRKYCCNACKNIERYR
ncbi:A disintegrin and metalloproteinase with thrombospondin motifs 1, partial [Operophtera brumata]